MAGFNAPDTLADMLAEIADGRRPFRQLFMRWNASFVHFRGRAVDVLEVADGKVTRRAHRIPFLPLWIRGRRVRLEEQVAKRLAGKLSRLRPWRLPAIGPLLLDAPDPELTVGCGELKQIARANLGVWQVWPAASVLQQIHLLRYPKR
jgi:hypothetical protein